MQQLSLEQLEVESYAVQPNEQELTDLKGGSTYVCWVPPIAEGIKTFLEIGKEQYGGGGSGPKTVTVKTYGADSTIVTITY